MARIAYLRCSTSDQSVEAQRTALKGTFDREFIDEGVSGAVLAADRPGFAGLLNYARDGDVVCVYAVDRLGRDALDIQATVRRLMERGVQVDVLGLGPLTGKTAELILAVLAQLADMEKARILERCAAGRVTARAALAATGRTHRGKVSLGRPPKAQVADVVSWRRENSASIAQTAEHFGLSISSAKRYFAAGRSYAGGA
jgi:putative DNA-invertase from lambdoid prophage Rac